MTRPWKTLALAGTLLFGRWLPQHVALDENQTSAADAQEQTDLVEFLNALSGEVT